MVRWKFSVWATARPTPDALSGVHVSSMPALPEGTQPSWYAKDVDHALEVGRQAREAEFSAHVLKPLHEEIPLIMGVFDRATGVFNERRSRLHELRGGFASCLHPLEDGLIDPTGHPATTVVAGALLLQETSPAGGGGLVAKMAAQLGRLKSNGQLLSRRTAGAVLLRVRAEALLAKEAKRGVG